MTIEPRPDFAVSMNMMTTRTPGCIDQESNVFCLHAGQSDYTVFVPDHVAASYGFKTFAIEFRIRKAAGRNWWLIPSEELARCLFATRLYPVVGGASGRYLHLGDRPFTHEDEAMPEDASQYYSTLKGVEDVQV